MKIKRMLVLASLLVTATAAPAEAVTLRLNNGMTVRYDFGDTQCSVIEMSGYGVGLPTAMPIVRAINASRYRDLQNVTVRTDLYQFNMATRRFELAVRGDEFRGLAADNNYVVSFRNARTGATHLVHDRLQWPLSTNGFYGVEQHITWHRSARAPELRRSLWLQHSPSFDTRFCFIQ